jgi:hypothetical protein
MVAGHMQPKVLQRQMITKLKAIGFSCFDNEMEVGVFMACTALAATNRLP